MNTFMFGLALGLAAVVCVNAGAIGGQSNLFGGHEGIDIGRLIAGSRGHSGRESSFGFEDEFDGFDGGHRGFDGGHRGFDGGHRGFDGGHRGFDGGHRGFDGGRRGFDIAGGRGGVFGGEVFGGDEFGGHRGGDFGGESGFGDPAGGSIFAQNAEKQGDRFALSAAERLSDRFGAKAANRDRAAIAAKQAQGDRVAAHKKGAAEDYINAKNIDEVAFQHDQSNKKNFQLSLVDQKADDKSIAFKARSGNQFNKGSRTAEDNKFGAEHHDSAAIKAAADNENKAAVDKDFKAENTVDAKQESIFEQHNEEAAEI